MPKQTNTKKKHELLVILRQNSRMSLTEISKRTCIPITTIYDRLKKACDDTITRYTVLLDFAKLGYTIRVQFFIKAQKNKREELFRYLLNHQNINNAAVINNGFDFACDALFKDLGEAEYFAKELDEKFNVSKIEIFYILQEFKRYNIIKKEEGV